MHPVRIFVLLRGLNAFGMFMQVTIYVPFLLSMGLTLSDVLLLNALYFLSSWFFEIPTGMVADGRSRAWSVRAGFLALAIGHFVYSYAVGFRSALAAELIAGLGRAFISGAFDAWFMDALKKHGEETGYRRHNATAGIVAAFLALAGSVAGNLLSPWGGKVCFAAGGTVAGITFLLSFPLMRGVNGEPAPHERVSEVEALKLAFKGLRSHAGLRWGAIASMIFGLALPFNHFWTPFYLGRISQGRLIWIWVPIYISIAGSAYLVRRGTLKIADDRRGMMLALVLTGIGLAGTGQFGGLAGPILLTMVHEFGRGMFEPHTSSYFQRRFESACRATAGSIQSFIESFGWSFFLFVITFATLGAPTNEATISRVWLFCGSIIVLSTGILWLFRPKDSRAFA